jgi:hypothetical protein
MERRREADLEDEKRSRPKKNRPNDKSGDL